MSSKDAVAIFFPTSVGSTKAAGKGAETVARKAGLIPKPPDLSGLQTSLQKQQASADAQAKQLNEAIRARRAIQNRGSGNQLLYQTLLGTRTTLG